MPRFEDDDQEPQEEHWEEEEIEGSDEPDEEDEESEAEEAEDFTSDEVLQEIANLVEESEELCDRGEFRKAVRLWRRVIDRFADEPIVFFYKAQATFRLLCEEVLSGGAWDSSAEASVLHEEVLSTLDEALVMDSEYIEALNLLGAAHMLRGDHGEAVKAWETSLKLDEDQPDVEVDLEEARKYLN
jgi:tetratricopeptide (TPR) repeat protein